MTVCEPGQLLERIEVYIQLLRADDIMQFCFEILQIFKGYIIYTFLSRCSDCVLMVISCSSNEHYVTRVITSAECNSLTYLARQLTLMNVSLESALGVHELKHRVQNHMQMHACPNTHYHAF